MQRLLSLIEEILSTVQTVSGTDPITDCYKDNDTLTNVLRQCPDEALRLADRKLRVFPFKNVKECWRRLYTDASLAKACHVIRENCGSYGQTICLETNGENDEKHRDKGIQPKEEIMRSIPSDTPWLCDVIRILDTALIMTGAPRRESAVEFLITILQDATKPEQSVFGLYAPVLTRTHEEPQPKRRRLIQQSLFPPDSAPVPKLEYPVQRVSAPSFEEFTQHVGNERIPLVITGAVDHWPALSTRPWSSSDYWSQRTFGGRRLVPVEVGRSYTDEGWGQRIMPFGEFIRDYIWRRESDSASSSRDSSESQTGYMAQHDLLAQIPALRNDIFIPDFCYTDPPGPEPGTPLYEKKLQKREAAMGKKVARLSLQSDLSLRPDDEKGDIGSDEPIVNTWIGPSWTISSLHHDPYHNILVQIVGAKYVRLYPPTTPASAIHPRGMEVVNPSSTNLEKSEREGGSRDLDGFQVTSSSKEQVIDMSNTSKVDVAAIELSPAEAETWDSLWPGFLEAEYVETTLREGECLYIPVGWWHYVRGLQAGISVSFWWN